MGPRVFLMITCAAAFVCAPQRPAAAQSLLADPDVAGAADMIAHTCQPKTYSAGRTIAGVFIAAIPGTAARFDCHVPAFKEQSFTVVMNGSYDITVAGA